MKTLNEGDFLEWARVHGLVVDAGYPKSAILSFDPNPGLDRFWIVPAAPERRPHFIASLLRLMGEWKSCRVWRHMGSWPSSADPLRINDVIELCILRGLDLPLGTADIVEFEASELDKLVTLMFSTTIFGWSVGEDLYVIPDSGRYLMQTDHHDVIHVSFRQDVDLERFVRGMEDAGFPLPDEPPDSTFKQPDWMN